MRWPKEDFASAVFESDLKSLQRLIALVYADHARDGAHRRVGDSRTTM